MLLPDALEFLYRSLMREQCDIAVGKKITFSPDGSETAGVYPNKKEIWNGTEGLRHSLEDHLATYAAWGKLYKKEWIGETRFVQGRQMHEDSYFVFQCLLKQPKVAVFDVPVLRYRLSENSISRSPVSERVFDILYFAKQKKKEIEEKFPELTPLTYNLMVKADMALLRNLARARGNQYRKDENACIRRILQWKAYFIPATAADEKWFFILTHHLYRPYKLAYRLKRVCRG